MNNLVKGVVLFALLAMVLLPASLAGAASNTVDVLIDEADDGECSTDCTLREAVALAIDGDTVDFAGLGAGTINLTQGEIAVTAGITIDGSTATITIDGGGLSRIFNVDTGGSATAAVINQLTLTNGVATGTTDGGAVIVTNGSLDITNSTISGSGTSGLADSVGGAIFVTDAGGVVDVLIDQSAILGNDAIGSSGGGIYVEDGGAGATLAVWNSTISGNIADSGSGIFNDAATLAITNSTISGNSAMGVGGASVEGINMLSFTAVNTIIANDTLGLSCSPGPGTQSNNIDSGTSCGWGSAAGSQSSTNPLLSSLGSYGGPTQTMALLPGSPAIDVADDLACSNVGSSDQRGTVRTGLGPNCDVGAFETQGFALALVSGDSQATPGGTAFALPLVVSVTPVAPEPVNGGIVEFRGPTSGAGTAFGGFTTQTIAAGAASLDVTANTTPGAYTVTADTTGRTGLSVDFNLANTAVVSTTTIDSDTPDPSYPGETVTVTVTVTGLNPGGTVDITGADTNCTVALTVGTGSCDVGFTASGSRTLTATYGGDTSNAGSVDTEAHEVFFPPGDSDLDGNADIFWRDVQQGATFISYFNGTNYSGTFKVLKRMVAAPWIMAGGGDFDRDGQTDIFWRNPVSGANVIAHYQGTTLVNFNRFQNQSPEWRAFGTGDVNKDRYPDIFWYNTDTMENEVWYMQDSTVLGMVDLPLAPAPWVPVAVADFNGDTNPDVVALNSVTGRAVIALLSATNLQAVAKLPAASSGWDACGTIDMNGDNAPDIVWRDPMTGANEAWIIQNNTRTSTVALPTVEARFQCMAGHK